jgi:4-amino-4-deoxy-L-arabinose transferase-like glycosyltransferase
MGKPGRGRLGFGFWLATWTVMGFGIRLGTVFGRLHRKPGGDPAYFHAAANLLVAGHGFINPWAYQVHNRHIVIQTASWPPLFVFVLAIPVVFGFHGFLASRVFSCVVGALAIAVTGLAGREIAGGALAGREVAARRVGLVAAFLLAVYPNIWDSDEIAGVEALTPLLIALVLWTAYRFRRTPSLKRAVAAGLAIGLATLGRDELALLVPFILVPITLLSRSISWRRRLALLGAGIAACLTIVMPWVGYNLSRFQDPVFISSGFGPTLASANCDMTYSGPSEGYWSLPCARAAPHNSHVDESVNAANDESYALKYIRKHENRLVPVTLARLGRGFGFFHPIEQIKFDWYVETRPFHWALVGLGMYYVLLALSIGGTLVLRRRKVPVFPLWAIGLDVVISMILAFGQTRYRTAFESSLVLLSAVQIEWFWSKLRPVKPVRDGPSATEQDEKELVGAPG